MVNQTHTFEDSHGDNHHASYILPPGYHVVLVMGHQRYTKINGVSVDNGHTIQEAGTHSYEYGKNVGNPNSRFTHYGTLTITIDAPEPEPEPEPDPDPEPDPEPDQR